MFSSLWKPLKANRVFRDSLNQCYTGKFFGSSQTFKQHRHKYKFHRPYRVKHSRTFWGVQTFLPALYRLIEKWQIFSGYITQKKMEKACELLTHSNLYVAEIAYRLGYKNAGSFSTQFKNYTGILPSEYRTHWYVSIFSYFLKRFIGRRFGNNRCFYRIDNCVYNSRRHVFADYYCITSVV